MVTLFFYMANAKFIKSVNSINEIPKHELPELVLCGRSNVGKSSFINSLLQTKNLAKVGATPGKTKFLNYFLVNEKFYVVDLPGLGYAKVSKTEREKWQKLISEFLSRTEKITLAIHIIDSRHKPTDIDVELSNILFSNNIPFIIVLNKVDKLKQSEFHKIKTEINEFYSNTKLNENLFYYSAVNHRGRKELINFLKNYFEI
ncbi:MAG: ribosome biogenesis GTP-binding protein YihA/YsxC [Ignavibacteriales bacterium]